MQRTDSHHRPGAIDGVDLTSTAPPPANVDSMQKIDMGVKVPETGDIEVQSPVYVPENSGVARIEAIQSVWGKHGKKFIIAGLAMSMVIYELDNTTVYTYYIYAQSHFHREYQKNYFVSSMSQILWG